MDFLSLLQYVKGDFGWDGWFGSGIKPWKIGFYVDVWKPIKVEAIAELDSDELGVLVVEVEVGVQPGRVDDFRNVVS